jgi:hypothetical protein
MSEHASFDLQSQSAATITNVGGDQITVQRKGGRTQTVGRIVAAAGLVLVFAGLGLLGYAAVFAVQQALPPAQAPSEVADYLAATLRPGAICLGAGIVLSRFGRLFASS